MPFLVDLAVNGRQWTRLAALDALIALTGSFEPDPECHDSALRAELLATVAGHGARLRVLLTSTARRERDLAAELLEQLTENG